MVLQKLYVPRTPSWGEAGVDRLVVNKQSPDNKYLPRGMAPQVCYGAVQGGGTGGRYGAVQGASPCPHDRTDRYNLPPLAPRWPPSCPTRTLDRGTAPAR